MGWLDGLLGISPTGNLPLPQDYSQQIAMQNQMLAYQYQQMQNQQRWSREASKTRRRKAAKMARRNKRKNPLDRF